MRHAKSAKRPSQAIGAVAEQITPGVPLDEETRKMLDLIARLIARGNFERAPAAAYFKSRLDRSPVGMHAIRQRQSDHTVLPAEVITQWHNLPDYLLNGRPRPLPARGTGLSIASLVRRLDPHADADEILKYLIDTRSVARVGNRFLPSARIVRHRLAPAQQQIHHRRVILALAQTVESNARQADRFAKKSTDNSSEYPGIYQFVTIGFVPESQMEEFRKEMRQLNDETLLLVDGVMARRSQKRKRGEHLVPVGEVIFMSENCPAVSRPAASRSAKTRRSRRT